MNRVLLVHRLLLTYQSLTVSLYPAKLDEEDNLEQISVNIGGMGILLNGIYSTDESQMAKFPIVYNSTDLLEDIQLVENSSYYIELEISGNYKADIITKIHNSSLTPFKKIPSFKKNVIKGVLNWKSYVGKDQIVIFINEDSILYLPIEIRSNKVNYLNDYRNMVDSITESLADIIWSSTSPSSLKMIKAIDEEPSLLEKFFFLREAMTQNYIPQFWQIIISSPTAKQTQYRRNINLGEVTSIDSQSIVSIVSRPEYLVECALSLYKLPFLGSKMPEVVDTPQNRLTFDTPENQFLLYWFKEMYSILNEILLEYDSNTLVSIETKKMLSQVNEMLNHSMFNEVSDFGYFNNNNLAIRRLPGYSGIFGIYEEYDRRGKLSWNEYFDLLYSFEVKPVYDIYEIWVLFEIINIIKNIATGDINYNISKGKVFRIRGITAPFGSYTIKLVYQKRCKSTAKEIPLTSYSIPMIPDYTISVWDGLNFLGGITLDAKYRYDTVKDEIYKSSLRVFEDAFDDLSSDTFEMREAKPLDLVKMHSYKDSIRGIYGSFVIFPGKDTECSLYYEQNTALPSVGAFPLYPSNDNASLMQNQRQELTDFIRTALIELTI